MIQISSPSIVIIECADFRPIRPNGASFGFSDSMAKVLNDPGITKVFCGLGGDLDALRGAESIDGDNMKTYDLQSLPQYQTPKGQPLSLMNILSSTCLGARWEKESIKKRQWWRLSTGAKMLSDRDFVVYAAGDAWSTLLAYHRTCRAEGTQWFPKIDLPLPAQNA